MSKPDLHQRSIQIIRAGQHSSGAYVAAPTFSQYGYSWFRDGTWIAFSMDRVGQRDSAEAFYHWGIRVLLAQQSKIDSLLDKLRQGFVPAETDYLPTRFTLDGRPGQEEWTDFQLDGYGAWLWGLVDHCQRADEALWKAARPAITLLVRYLESLWASPNYDCWEEHRQHIHPATLAALYGGLRAVQALEAGLIPDGLPEQIRDFTLRHCVTTAGHFCKYIGSDEVDASLLWLAIPYGLVTVDDPRFQATLVKIERDLHVPGGGVYRYRGDTYFGGGEWPLLAAWLGWTYLELGRRAEAHKLLDWIASQADAAGQLPEQVDHHLLAPDYFPQWVARWGTSANPLLWSHAMYLVLEAKKAR
jgi:GH15 family glucan-1,4-alpha-glucosidase